MSGAGGVTRAQLELERGALYAIVQEPETIWPILREHWGPGLFALEHHQVAAAAAVNRFQRGDPVDYLLVIGDLSVAGQQSAADTLASVARHTGNVVNAPEYFRRLVQLRDARESTGGGAVCETDAGFRAGGFAFVRASEVQDETVEWLVPNFIPRGELTDLSADPGVGKSSLTASIAAAVTTGRVVPHGTARAPANVVLFATEDRLGLTLKARLRAEGADLTRVVLFDIREAQPTPCLPRDLDAVEALVARLRAELVVLDPALEFMDSELDSHRQQDVQRFVAALAAMAHRTRAAVITVRHLNKATGTAAIYKAAGSIAFVARARMALLAAKDKERGGRALTVIKGNIGKDTHSITFDVVEKDGSTVVAWGEPTVVTADELVNQDPRKRRGPAPEAMDAACDFIAEQLEGGRCMAKSDLVKAAREAKAGSRSTLYQAAKRMGLVDVTVNLRAGWRLP